MTTKQYHHENIVYQFNPRFRKWEFKSPTFIFLTKITKRGKRAVDVSHKIARIVNGALKRTKGNGMDNLARANVQHVQSV